MLSSPDKGYIWGRDTKPLLNYVESGNDGPHGYDLLILSDLIFNHSQHQALLSTLLETLSPTGKAIVFFSPHRPWLLENDLNFFKMAEATERLVAKKVWEEKCAAPMFEVDRGDVELRKTVFGVCGLLLSCSLLEHDANAHIVRNFLEGHFDLDVMFFSLSVDGAK